MYERFYHLRERPFSLSPDPDYLYPSRVHTEALGYLRYGIEGRAGFVVITGEIGSGKTTLLQTALRGVDQRTTVARLVSTMLDDRELLEAIMLDFGLDPPAGRSKPHLLRDLARFLVDQRQAGRLPLLIIDEAQNLSETALEEVRMLSNLETEKSKLIQIVLIGQPNLHDVLNRPGLEQLRQRVTVRYHLRPLDPGDTAAYINHRLRKAAIGAPLVFSAEVTDLIAGASHGVPRTINVIADAVLLFGYGEDTRIIDAALVRDVIADLESSGVLTAPSPADDAAAREARIALRERQLAEQHRILTEQYRVLKMRESQADAAPVRASAPPLPLKPALVSSAHRAPAPLTPLTGGATRAPEAAFASRPGVWTQVLRGLLGLRQPTARDQTDRPMTTDGRRFMTVADED